ncbi:MAG: methylmalonyl-CoA epimerase [Ferruginibacter sp.]
MELNYIEHIGIAVKDLASAIKFYEDTLGLSCYLIEEVSDQQVKTAFFKIGQTKIELLESTSINGPVAKFIEQRGEGIHHIAFAVDNIEAQLSDAGSKSITLIDKAPRKGAEGLDIAFLHPKSMLGVLTELCENKSVG